MREKHLQYLRCPGCQQSLQLLNAERADDRIRGGLLRCPDCGRTYPIAGYIPRFVDGENYAASFGLEWTVHDRTQYDAASGAAASEQRFFDETGWPRHLEGELLIEAGSGSGRFTEQALRTGAIVLSLDYSRAVESNYRSNGQHPNLLLVQGDIFRMPFPRDSADRLFCFGVLQHTPDPRGALASIVQHLRPGGDLVADIYAKTFARYALQTKYWIRPLTRRMEPEPLYSLTSRYVERMWPLGRRVQRIPRIGRALSWRLLIPDYSDIVADDEVRKEWARLDIFDMLAPRYDKPASRRAILRWCEELPLEDVRVRRGYNGFEIHARRRGSRPSAVNTPASPT